MENRTSVSEPLAAGPGGANSNERRGPEQSAQVACSQESEGLKDLQTEAVIKVSEPEVRMEQTPSKWDDHYKTTISGWTKDLALSGTLLLGDSSFEANEFTGSSCSHPGPKKRNDDFALIWISKSPQRVRLIIAIADGVGSSWLAESAAQLVCCVGASAIAAAPSTSEAQECARLAFSSAQKSLDSLAEYAVRFPEHSRPKRCRYLSTWKHILKKGVYLQSTLMLAWIDNEVLRIAMIGDGGIIWQSRGSNSDPLTSVKLISPAIVADDLGTSALSPFTELPSFTMYHEEPMPKRCEMAAFTDGISRDPKFDPETVLTTLRAYEIAPDSVNCCERYITSLLQNRPDDLVDNMTLAFVRSQRPG